MLLANEKTEKYSHIIYLYILHFVFKIIHVCHSVSREKDLERIPNGGQVLQLDRESSGIGS